MGMDRKLFKKKPSLFKRVIKILLLIIIYIVILLIPACIGASISYVSFWWKTTVFIDKLDYKWALEEQYNNGKYHERLCSGLTKDRKIPLEGVQKEFCDKHNNYKNHPESFMKVFQDKLKKVEQ